MFKGLKKKIESDQKVGVALSPSKTGSKPGGPVRVSSTSGDDVDEISSVRAKREATRSPAEENSIPADVRGDGHQEENTPSEQMNAISEIPTEDKMTIKDRQLSELKSLVALLEKRIADLQQEIVVCKNDRVARHDFEVAVTRADSLEQKCKEMQHQLETEFLDKRKCSDSLQQQISSLQNECESQQQRLTALEHDLEGSQRKCGSLQQELEVKTTKLEKVAKELQNANKSVGELQSELSLAQNRNTELEEKMAAERAQHEANGTELQRRVHLLEQRLKDTEMSDGDHLQAVLNERDSLELTLSETKSQMVELETRHQEKVAQLQLQAESLAQERNMDRLSTRTLNDEVRQLQLKLSDVQDMRDRDREQHNEEMTALAQRNKDLLSKCTSHEAERMELTEEAVQLKATVEALKESNLTASTASHTQLEELQQKHAELQQMVEVRSQQIEQVREEVRRKDELVASTEEQLGQETSKLHQSIQERQQEVESLLKQVADARQVHERNMADKQRTIEELYEQVQSLESKMEQRERNSEILLPATLSLQQDTSTEWQQQMEQLQREKADLEEQLIEKNKALKTQQQRLTDLKKTLHKELKMQTSADGKTEFESRDVNFEYLRNVLLKFLCSRDHEARQLVKAICTLLQFSAAEERLVTNWLDYRASWFGSAPLSPSVPKPSSH